MVDKEMRKEKYHFKQVKVFRQIKDKSGVRYHDIYVSSKNSIVDILARLDYYISYFWKFRLRVSWNAIKC